jgi:hypothetical protein
MPALSRAVTGEAASDTEQAERTATRNMDTRTVGPQG